MSHVTRLKTKMMEKVYILRALDDLGYRYEQGEIKLKTAGGETVQVEVKILLRMSFDIGLRSTPQGYEVIADWWGVRGVNQKDLIAKLTQRYAYHASRAKLESQGFSLVEESTKDGQIHLTLRRMA